MYLTYFDVLSLKAISWRVHVTLSERTTTEVLLPVLWRSPSRYAGFVRGLQALGRERLRYHVSVDRTSEGNEGPWKA